MKSNPLPIKAQTLAQARELASSYEGASRTSQELALWRAPMTSADMDILPDKEMLDARVIDTTRNDAYVLGGVNIHRDSIVGSHFLLNSKPKWQILGLSESWAEEFQTVVEAKFTNYAESPECWIDASRKNTLTGLVRLGIASFFMTGEVVNTMEWIKQRGRVYSTCVQAIDPARLSNPNGQTDTRFLRRGILHNKYGQATAASIRLAHPGDWWLDPYGQSSWKTVPIYKPWGRRQVIHIFEQLRPAQSRGISSIVSALKEMRMTKKFRDVTLQNAVLQGYFAAVMESELPPEAAYASIGSGGTSEYITEYLTGLSKFVGGGKGIHIDGARIAHAYPGTKLNVQKPGTPGGIGTGFEQSLLRYIAAVLGVSYEQLSKDYSQTNYSSAKAGMAEAEKYAVAKKRLIADRQATLIFRCWLEEALNNGELPIPSNAPFWYKDGYLDSQVFDAYSSCTWVGASKGQVDELKETQAAVLRIKYNLSTHEDEIARQGGDFRQVFAQRARENQMLKDAELQPPGAAQNDVPEATAGNEPTASSLSPDKEESQGLESQEQ